MNPETTIRPSAGGVTLERHLAAFAKRDVDAVMADYGEQSVFVTPQGVLRGKAAIRSLFDDLIAEFSAPTTTMSVHQQHAVGPLAYINWSAETPQNRYEFVTDTLLVADGLIRWQTFAAVIKPK